MIIKSLGLAGALKKKRSNGATVKYLPVPEDFKEFASLCRIRSGKGFTNFNLYDYQESLVRQIQQRFGTVVLKSRQLGISETLIAWIIHESLLNPGTQSVFFSLNQGSTSQVGKRARLMIESIPQYCALLTDNLQVLSFHNGSTIFFRNSSINGSRGLESVKIGIFDECEFIPEAAEIYKSFLPATSMLGDDARIILNSTPSSQSSFYFEKLMNGNDGDLMQVVEKIKNKELPGAQFLVDRNGWNKCILHWRSHPVYGADDNYLNTVKERFQLDQATVNREYDLSFEENEKGVFDIQILKDTTVGKLSKVYNPELEYFVTTDPAAQGKDYWVSIVFSWDEEKEVFEVVDFYRNRQKTTEYNISKVWDLCEKYEIKDGIVEGNSLGQPICEQMDRSRTTTFTPIITSNSSKAARIQGLMMLMESKRMILPDNDLFRDEFLGFVKINDRMAAANGHDDIVMACSFIYEIYREKRADVSYIVPRPKTPVKSMSRLG